MKNSYADNRKMDLEFEIVDSVYLKISPVKGVIKFDKKGKHTPWYVGPYKVFKRVRNVSYELKLTNKFYTPRKFHDLN